MTVIYWAAAAAALASAAGAVAEFAHDRLPALAAWALSMTALSASLALAAAARDVMHGDPGPASWACAGLGILGTWAFAEVLSSGAGDTRRVVGMITTPLLGSGCAVLLLLGLHWAGSHGNDDAGRSEVTVIGTQLTLVIYYVPGLGRIATLAVRSQYSFPGATLWPGRAIFVETHKPTMARSAMLLRGGGRAVVSVMFARGSACR